MQDQSQLEVLCELSDLNEDGTPRSRRHISFQFPAIRVVAAASIFAAVICIGGLAQSRGRSERTAIASTVGMTVLDSRKCAWGRMNCTDSQCCGAAGMQCYSQSQYYSQCRESCLAGAPDTTHWDEKPWDCKELGQRTPGEPPVCAKQGEECSSKYCCEDPGFQCYKKNTTFASCRKTCDVDGPFLSDSDGKFWSCEKVGERKPEAQEWVSEKCSKEGESCMDSKCCYNAGEACFTQNEYWAVCRSGCNPDFDQGWDCKQLGTKTPASPGSNDKLAPWVVDQCSKPDDGCIDSRCCLGMGYQCYKKNEYWGQCKQECQTGIQPGDPDQNVSWSCETVGPRSIGLAIKGAPSLYCFSVIAPYGYEKDLMTAISKKGAGIFACDHYDMLSADESIEVNGEQSTVFQGAQVIGSVDGTAGNTELFVNAWRKVIEIGQWADHAFTVKLDPDAVLIPEKLRWHLNSFVGGTIFVINCEAWNMIYGSIEIFSYGAMKAWGEGSTTCNAPPDFGEDKYMTQCMDHLGVQRVDDFGVVGDQLCGSFTDCRNLANAAFHPFKDITSWMNCWQDAMNVIS